MQFTYLKNFCEGAYKVNFLESGDQMSVSDNFRSETCLSESRLIGVDGAGAPLAAPAKTL